MRNNVIFLKNLTNILKIKLILQCGNNDTNFRFRIPPRLRRARIVDFGLGYAEDDRQKADDLPVPSAGKQVVSTNAMFSIKKGVILPG